eukprot:1297097-Ditylum_brightwellii.AAC.1
MHGVGKCAVPTTSHFCNGGAWEWCPTTGSKCNMYVNWHKIYHKAVDFVKTDVACDSMWYRTKKEKDGKLAVGAVFAL